VLRNPSLRRVESAFLLFNAVEFGTWVAILLYAYGASGPELVGVVALAQLLPAALVAPIAATLADRFDRRRVLVAGYLVQAATFGATSAGMLLGAPPLVVYAAAAAAASSLTITRPAQGALLPSLARTPEELTATNGLSGTVEGAGVLLGPLVAAGILVVATPGAVLAAATAACLVAAVLVSRLAAPAGGEGGAAARAGAEPHAAGAEAVTIAESSASLLVGGIRAMTANADTLLVVAILGLRMVTSGAMDVLFVLLALEVFNTGEAGAGLLTAALGLGTVIGGAASFALVGRRRLAPALAVSALAWSGAVVVVGGVASPLLAPIVIAAGGIGYAAVDVAGRTILQRVTPDRLLARVLGALEGVGLVGLAIGSLIAPIIATTLGIRTALIAVGMVLPVAIAIALLGLRRIDRRTAVPTRELALLAAVPLFAPLAPPQLESVARRGRWMTADAGETLIREGDPGDRYYVLESGAVRVSRGEEELRVARGRGYGFGEIALLRGVPRTATVAALEPCIILVLDRAGFLEAVTGHPQAHDVASATVDRRLADRDGDG
jgi:MFS family permease